jgi:hypothetical protein
MVKGWSNFDMVGHLMMAFFACRCAIRRYAVFARDFMPFNHIHLRK